MHQTVTQTKERSGWPARRTLAALGVSRRSYYRWLKEEEWAQQLPAAAVKPVQAYEALPQEKEAVLAYARAGPTGGETAGAGKSSRQRAKCVATLRPARSP